MKNNILRHFKYHRTATYLIILSYIIAIVFLSVGVSYLNEQKEIDLDNHSGKSSKSLILSINITNLLEVDRFFNYLESDFKDFDIKVSHSMKIDEDEVIIIGHEFNKKPLWKPDVIYGKYFNEKVKDDNSVVVGVNLKDKIKSDGNTDYINIKDTKYKVNGYIGRKNRKVPWADYVYMSLDNFYNKFSDEIKDKGEVNILLLSDKNITTADGDLIVNKLKSNFNEILISTGMQDPNTNISSTKYVIGISALIFLVAIVNIMAMTLFWILDRTKEIAVRKILGFTNDDIIKQIIKEMMTFGFISIAISIVIQIILNFVLNNVLKISLIIGLNNIIISFLVVLFTVIFTSIVPIKIILNTKLTSILV